MNTSLGTNTIPKVLDWADKLQGVLESFCKNTNESPTPIEVRKIMGFMYAPFEEVASLIMKYPKFAHKLSYIKNIGEYEYEDTASDLNVTTLIEQWVKNKQIYSFDADFLDELLSTETTVMTKDAWDYLPYDTFYIDLSNNKKLYDMFGYGMFITTTKDIESGNYGVYSCRITDNLYFGDSFLVKNDDYEHIVEKDATKELPVFETPIRDDKNKTITIQQNGTWKHNVGLYKSLIMQILTYLTSIEPDVKENEITKKTYRKPKTDAKPKNKFSEVQMWNVGEAFGISYRKWKKEREIRHESGNGGGSGASGVKKRPHSRKAHWSHYWYGSGDNKVRRPKWISATFVNASDTEVKVTVNTVSK